MKLHFDINKKFIVAEHILKLTYKIFYGTF